MRSKPSGTGVYIHIPFCAYKCHYCDFATSLGKEDLQEQYCDVISQEIISRLGNTQNKPLVETIFYGGGTPGLLQAKHLSKIHETLLANITLMNDNEISLETTPETVTLEKAQFWRTLGINRLSIGVQSFNDSELKALARGHTVAQATLAFDNAVSAGFQNINCDLMYGLPGQNLDSWRHSIASFIKLADKYPQIKHISAYGLELSESAPLHKIIPAGSPIYPSEDEYIQQLEYLVKALSEAGFVQYEISNFAKPGFHCRHNLKYWQQGEYHAFGVSAHRYLKPYRSSNWRSLKRYLEDCLGNETFELIDEPTRVKEAIMLGLRMNNGIELMQFKQDFGLDLEGKHANLIEILSEKNMLICKNGRLKLTPSAQPVANSVISAFF